MTASILAGAKPADDDLERRAYGKVSWRLVPFLMLCYVIAYLDRVNVGFAKLQMSQRPGVQRDRRTASAPASSSSATSCSRCRATCILHRVGARIWIARIMITWGLVSARVHVRERRRRCSMSCASCSASPRPASFRASSSTSPTGIPPQRRAKDRSRCSCRRSRSRASSAARCRAGSWTLSTERQRLARLAVDVPDRGDARRRSSASATLFYLDNGVRTAKWLTDDEKDVARARHRRTTAAAAQSTHSVGARVHATPQSG